MTKVQIFDPPMCCSSGVCGAKVDPVLPRIAEDLRWLAAQGVTVERFNLAQQPHAFTDDKEVRGALARAGLACLPLVVVNGVVAVEGRYPERAELGALAGLAATA